MKFRKKLELWRSASSLTKDDLQLDPNGPAAGRGPDLSRIPTRTSGRFLNRIVSTLLASRVSEHRLDTLDRQLVIPSFELRACLLQPVKVRHVGTERPLLARERWARARRRPRRSARPGRRPVRRRRRRIGLPARAGSDGSQAARQVSLGGDQEGRPRVARRAPMVNLVERL